MTVAVAEPCICVICVICVICGRLLFETQWSVGREVPCHQRFEQQRRVGRRGRIAPTTGLA